MATETEQIINAIKESGARTERALDNFSGEIRGMGHAITKALAHTTTVGGSANGQAWAIATFTVVILSIAGLAMNSIGHNRELSMVMDKNQGKQIIELDRTIQNEIAALEKLTGSKFDQAESDSERRHDEQERKIIEIKSWFEAPSPIDGRRE